MHDITRILFTLHTLHWERSVDNTKLRKALCLCVLLQYIFETGTVAG
jgi:hypothetical protein